MNKAKKRMIIIVSAAAAVYLLILLYIMWGRYFFATIDDMSKDIGADDTEHVIWEYYSDPDNPDAANSDNYIAFYDTKKGWYTIGDEMLDCNVECEDKLFSHRIKFYTYDTDENGKPFDPKLVCEGSYKFNDSEHLIVYVDDEFIGENTGGRSVLEFEKNYYAYAFEL